MMQAVLNHLWQSTVFGVAAALVAFALRKSSASVRFWLWLAASVKFLIPFAVISAIGGLFAPAFDPGPELRTLGEAAQRIPDFMPSGPVITVDRGPIFDPAAWLAGAWAAGAIAILGARLLRWRSLHRVLQRSRPLPSVGPIPIRASRSVLEPGLFGILKPVVLLPESLPQTLGPDEIEAILAHEAAHWRRRDNLWAAIHMLVAALVWFHPMVWWIGRRMIAEREQACDAAVVQRGHPREVYARAILQSCRAYLRMPLACVSGASGSGLADRIETIMTMSAFERVTARQKAVLLTLGALVLAAPLLTGALAGPATGGAGWLADLSYGGPTPGQVAHDLADQKRPRTPAPFDPARFDAYVGDYQAGPYAILEIVRRGDRFVTQMTGQPPAELYPEGGARFFYKAVVAQITFQTGADGRTNSLILHQNGLKMRLRRLDPASAAELRARLMRRLVENRPSPGTEDYVSHWLASTAAGRPDYSRMSPGLAHAAREQWAMTRAMFEALGPFRNLRFLHVSPQGADLYEADFQNRRLFIRVEPLVQGKAASQFFRFMS
ncbi:MAG TPA: M56 family metallopeptidase [Caulobacteraceae bacterium]|jgi:beta-lactamase regulating signal transducer with metallopeptidase domain